MFKIVFEIESDSKRIIEKFSEALNGFKENKSLENIEATTSKIKKEKETIKDIESQVLEETKLDNDIPVATTPTYSSEDLTKMCIMASDLGLGVKVKELIRNKFEVMKVSEIPENKREEFATDLRELGVRI